MDVYYPTGATSDKKYPLIVFCHAGGFEGGNRFNVSAICDRFAEEGFVSVGFDYRVGYHKGNGRNCEADTAGMNNAVYRAMQDCNACLRYLKAHADDFNIDTNNIFLGGSSAGGALALNDAYTNDSVANIYFHNSYVSLGGTQSGGNNLPANYKIKGIIAMWGALWSDKMIDTNYRAYPTIIFKGDDDAGLPDSMGHFEGCQNYPVVFAGIGVYARLRVENTPAVFHLLPQANHPAYDDQFCVQQSACYLRAIMQGRAYSGTYSGFAPSCQ
jgi:dienelactone hydrolase